MKGDCSRYWQSDMGRNILIRATHFALPFLFFANIAICFPSAAADIKKALVVGNDSYGVAPLINSVKDANAVARELKSLGFDVTLVTDAPYAKMASQFDQFAKQVSGASNVLAIIYYSGHGVQVQDRNLLLGTDVKKDTIEMQSVDIQKILGSIKPGSNSSYLVILDACRQYVSSSGKMGLAPLDAPPGTLIAFSTSPGRLASDGDPKDGNGAYTKHLVKQLQAPGVPVETIFKKVRASVLSETKGEQIPWENSSMLRDFYFRGSPAGSLAQVDYVQESEAASGGSVSRLSPFYQALAGLKGKAYVSAKDLSALNNVFKAAYGFEVNAADAKFLAENVLTIGAYAVDLPGFIRDKYGISSGIGVLVGGVDSGGVAERLGVKVGDIVIQLNGKDIQGLKDVLEKWKGVSAGQIMTATLLRDGEEIQVSGVVERHSVDNLALVLANGKYRAEKNYSKARELLELLAAKGNAVAQGVLAGYAKSGIGFDGKDYTKALDYATKAAEQGGLEGVKQLSLAYQFGQGVPADPVKSLELLNPFVATGEGWALGWLAQKHISGSGVEKDYVKARSLAERSGYRGDVDGAFIMAMIYQDGLGVPKNVDEAERWYRRALELGGPNNAELKNTIDMKIRMMKNPLGGLGVFLDILSGGAKK